MLDPQSLLPPVQRSQMDSGLTLCLVPSRQAPLVTTALWYRAGTRDEEAACGGTAHFLEHMMFKGSARYGPGEIDRATQAMGGANNAFTSHDATVYHFSFAPDRWHRALEIEADRMAGLTLDPDEVDRERQVILEEISMYEDDPWAALEQQVATELFPGHPYGLPVLGTRESLHTIDAQVLARFHHRFYRPGQAVLVVAGDVDTSEVQAVEQAFAQVAPEAGGPRPSVGPAAALSQLRRVQRRRGQVPRLLLALKAPPADHPDHACLKLALALLASGRASLLHRRLVDEGQLCSWVSADGAETLDPGLSTIALEVVPGVEVERAEEVLLESLRSFRTHGVSDEELARGRKVALADWIFGHEKLHEQALLVGQAVAFWGEEFPARYLERMLNADREQIAAVAERYLNPESGAVLGWSLPEEEAGS